MRTRGYQLNGKIRAVEKWLLQYGCSVSCRPNTLAGIRIVASNKRVRLLARAIAVEIQAPHRSFCGAALLFSRVQE